MDYKLSNRPFYLVTVVMVPVTICVPLMIVTVPPPVVRIPAAFALRIQITPPLVRLVAALAVFANRLIQLCFRMLNLALALRVVVRVRLGYGNQHRRAQSRGHNCCYCKSFEAL
jgi:hypothetical protein